MKLRRLSTDKPDFVKLGEMISAMNELLDGKPNTELTIEDLCLFQDEDGSFKLFDSYDVPSEARVDFCYTPTYIGAAIFVKKYLAGEVHLKEPMEKALLASVRGGLSGHGYDAEKDRISALKIFIKGGLHEFLECNNHICPEFHNAIHNILHQYKSNLLRKCTKGAWGEDYSSEWQEIVDNLQINKRLYISYGSNMDKSQMILRCPNAIVIGKTYLENWELTMPFYANIERKKGKKTPVLIWEITNRDEITLSHYEGYPKLYDKTDIIVNIDGNFVSAMAYVMTDEYKKCDKTPRSGYIEQILRGYRDAGFSEDDLCQMIVNTCISTK